MGKRQWKTDTLTSLLREAIAAAPSHKQVAREANVSRQSLLRFARGDQSLRLDVADKLAAYFDIQCRWKGKP